MLSRDAARLVLMEMNDKDLLNMCQINEYYRNKICNDQFFHRRLLQKYPDTLQNKPKDMSYKDWHLRVVYYVAKLKEEFNYDYTGGNPKVQLEIFTYNKPNGIAIDAARKGELNLIKYLENKDLVPPGMYSYMLRFASEYGKLDVVKYLIEKEIGDKNDLIISLSSAAGNSHLDVVKYLIAKGVNINGNGNLPLKSAISDKKLEMVKYLVEHGADIHSNNNWALRYSEEWGNTEITDYLRTLS